MKLFEYTILIYTKAPKMVKLSCVIKHAYVGVVLRPISALGGSEAPFIFGGGASGAPFVGPASVYKVFWRKYFYIA